MNLTDLPEKLKEFLDELSLVEDQQDRINILIDYADKFKDAPADIAKKPFYNDSKVPFCESEAYVFSKMNEDKTIKFYYAVDNPQGISAKALCAIFDSTLTGEKPEVILKIPVDIVFEIFGRNISMGKNLGLTGILQIMQRQAKKFIGSESIVNS